MMKKFLTMLLTLFVAISSSACSETSSKTNDYDKVSSSTSKIKHSGKRISGTITGGSVFSEELALVSVDGDKEVTYCINKDGYIVFEIDKKLVANGTIYQQFINGYTLIDGGICNTKGEITYPEDVGATKFYSIAMEGGYIVAEKVTSDYSSAKLELGVMNMDFQWVVQPSEQLYNAVGDDLWLTETLNTESFYCDDVIYFQGSQCYLNVKSGEIYDIADVELPSNKWHTYSDGTFRDYDGNIIVDLSEHNNIVLSAGSCFKNGKAPVKFYNREADTNYFTIINEKGEFLFEPVEVKNIGYLYFDGEYVLISDSFVGVEIIQSYNSEGELLGELDTKTLDKNMSYSCDINNGVIVIYGGYNYSHNCYYFNVDFSPLF